MTHFSAPAPAAYLAEHPEEYVLTVDDPFREVEGPVLEHYFGAEHVMRYPDGSMELVGVSDAKAQEFHLASNKRVLHRARCQTLKDHSDWFQMICGPRDELEEIMEDFDKLCPSCL